MLKLKNLYILLFIFTSSYTISALPENISELVEDSAPAVVKITSKIEVTSSGYRGLPPGFPPEFERYFPNPPQQKREGTSQGSGFILKDNFILTNFHVVENAKEVTVSLSDRREFIADIVGVDPLSDLAVLKIKANNLPSVNIGNSDILKVGDWVVAIGSPYRFDFSVTAGIVSAKGRDSSDNNGIGSFVPYLQHDAAINRGNSGGPLFNLDGKVIGINAQIYSSTGGYQGLAFAIPINVAIDVANQIISSGEVSRGYLGVSIGEVDSDLADALGMNKPYGAVINDVVEGGSADLAGLLSGDVIVEFDNKQIKFSSDLRHTVVQIKPGTQAQGKVVRDGQEIVLDFILGELPENNGTFIPTKTQTSSDPIGFSVADIDRENPSMTNMPDGVIVSRVNPNSNASGKVNRGDIVTMIQFKGKKYQIVDVISFNTAMKNFSTGDKVALHLLRGGNRFIRSITIN